MTLSKSHPSHASSGIQSKSDHALFTKLSLRNARRQARDYLVYFVTMILVVALMYAFNGLIFSDEVRFLSENTAQLPLVIALASIVVIRIICWLVSYTTTFMLSRRSREFGTYILIGLENGQVARLFLLENLIVGGFSLIAGILLGSFLFQAMRAMILTMFGTPYRLAFSVSPPAALLTIAYFVFIYLLAQRKCRKRIRSMKIYELIYFEKVNEEIVIQASKKRRRIFTASIVLGILGTLLLLMGNLLFGILGAGCIIAFLYGFFLSFASGVPAYFEKRPAKKYSGHTLLVFRTLTAKLASIGILMATISLLFTVVLISEGSGQCFNALFWERAAQNSAFDLFIGIKGKEPDFTDYLEYIEANISVKASRTYDVYLSDDTRFLDYLQANVKYYFQTTYDKDSLMKFSDYAALREMMGCSPVTPVPGTYLIHCMPHLEKPIQDSDILIQIGGRTLTAGGIYTENFNQKWDTTNGHMYILVVPDEVLENRSADHRIYAAMTEEPVSKAQFEELEAIEARHADMTDIHSTLYAKSQEETEAADQTVLFAFPLYYLALILTMTAAAILTIQQLSESERYRRQFALLRKLGMDRREMEKTLRKQFTIYYAMPALPPVLISVPFVFYLGNSIGDNMLIGTGRPPVIVLCMLALFFCIYAIYIVLAYTGLKRDVLPD